MKGYMLTVAMCVLIAAGQVVIAADKEVSSLGCAGSSEKASLKESGLVPMPKGITLDQGRLELGTRIVVATRDLRPLAEVVAGEILLLTGNKMSVVEGGLAQPGDVWLETTPARKGALKKGLQEDQSYVLEVNDRVRVCGGSYAAVAFGTVTLLQALEVKDATLTLPRCLVKDEPAAAYRGLLVDVARKPHSIRTLQHCIELCRWYKIRYLQLHLTDDQLFTFPSTAYPKLATPGRAYTLDQLRGLEKFAKDRGVVIVPEFDVPGHAGALVNAMPELFAVKGGARKGWSVTMNFAKEDVCLAVETIIEEMLDVFQSTPFFHIGADESNFTGFDQDPFFQEMYKKGGITADLGKPCEGRTEADHPKYLIKPEGHPQAYELFLRFIVRLNKKVKSCGRQALIWEGFSSAGITKVPTDMIVMPYHMRNHRPDWLVSDGYSLINTSSADLYVVGPWAKPELKSIYKWDAHRFEWKSSAWKMPIVLPPSAPVLGAQMCSWEQDESAELPTLRKRLAVMSQRLWNPGFDKGFNELEARLKIADTKLTTLLGHAETNAVAFSLWQLPGQTRSQMNSYVIKTAGNELIVIDGGTKGDADYLRKFIQDKGSHVHAWFISHPHLDHVDALTEILNKPMGIKVDAVYGSLPDEDWLKKHQDSGALRTQRALKAALKKSNCKLLELSPGQKIKFQGAIFEILAVRNPELTVNAINNQSAVWRVDGGGKSVLFLGDLGVEGGEKLLTSPYRSRLKADYIQMSHHGQNGVSEEFYKTVNPNYLLWPTPDWLWDNVRGGGRNSGPWKTLEVRAWMEKLNIKKHYVAKDGLHRIDFLPIQ